MNAEMEVETDTFDLLANVEFDKFIELSESLLDEMSGYIPEPWIQLTADLNWPNQSVEEIKGEFSKIIIEAIYCPDNKRCEYLQSRFDLDRSKHLAQGIQSRKLDLAKELMKQHNASVKPVLDDFDWSVKWILGNSASTVMKYPLVKLDLITVSHNDKNDSPISIELTKTELETLLNVLEEQYDNM